MGMAPADNLEKTTSVAVNPVEAKSSAPISKRAAKKAGKGKLSAQPLSSTAANEEDSANNMATIDHPYLSFLHKRIRSYKKKLEKIKSLETAQSVEGKVLNPQQLELVGNKLLMEKMIAEFETLRGQFIEVYLQEEAAKKKEEAKQVTAAKKEDAHAESEPAATLTEDSPVPVMEKESALLEDSKSFDYVQDLLKTLHVVNLHQALGKEVPMVLDFFSKVLLGNTRPPAELSYEDNLAESLEEAKKYLQRSNKIVACDMSYRDLREIVDKLTRISEPEPVVVEEVVVVEETIIERREELPQINFFTDSQLEPHNADIGESTSEEEVEVTDDKEAEHAVAPEEIQDPVGQEEPQDSSYTNATELLTEETPIPAPPKSFAAAASSAPLRAPKATPSAWNREKEQTSVDGNSSPGEKTNQRRRPQSGRWRNGNNSSKNGGSPPASGNGSNNAKPRRPRQQRANDENSGYNSANRSSDARPPRTDRPFRKQPASSQQQSRVSPQA